MFPVFARYTLIAAVAGLPLGTHQANNKMARLNLAFIIQIFLRLVGRQGRHKKVFEGSEIQITFLRLVRKSQFLVLMFVSKHDGPFVS